MKKGMLCLLLILIVHVPAKGFAKTDLLVYTAVETELMPLYKNAFEKTHPDISIHWVRDSAGIITARLLAEKDAPKADVVFGLNVASLLVLDNSGIFESYVPKGAEALPAFMRDSRQNPVWHGMSACPVAIIVNAKELEKAKLDMPKTWQDLTDPRYKGHIVMSSPTSSGTAYTIVSSWRQHFGADAAWKFMTDLDKNIKMYTQSGSRPAEMAARGEITIGLSEAAFARTLKLRGAPIEVIVLGSPVPIDMEGSSLVKGGKNADAAKKFLDFSLSPEMAHIVAERHCVTAQPSVTRPEARAIPEMAGNYDFSRAGKERQTLIDEWRKRFDVR